MPGLDTFSAVDKEISYGMELLRHGATPVLPVAGLVAMLAIIFWGSGWAATASILAARPEFAGAVPLAFYLQLATIDRGESPLWSTLVFIVSIAGSLLISGTNRTSKSAEMKSPGVLTLPRYSKGLAWSSMILTVALGVGVSHAIAGSDIQGGTLAWRASSDVGGLYGGRSGEVFANLQQNLLNLSDEPVFIAAVSEPSPPNEEIYWQLITLDVYDGNNWLPGESGYARGGVSRYENPQHLFQGPTQTVAARIRIASLTGQILPVLYSTTKLDSNESYIYDSFGIRKDGSVRIDVSIRPEWEYQILADLPIPNLGALVRQGDELSPMFAAAAEAGAFDPPPGRGITGAIPDDLDYFTELPPTIDSRLRSTTAQLLGEASTDFERGILLESWFRDDSRFVYSTVVDSGGQYLNLMDWLWDPTSLNYRTGYCEQFATAMALMARSVGIPSRVVLGYTPGELMEQANGTEVVVIRARNAHAWVQLWMDGQGWVRFDPTPRSDQVNPGITETAFDFDPSVYLPAPDPSTLPDPQRPLPNDPETPTTVPTPGLEGLDSPFRLVIPPWLKWILGLLGGWMLIPLTRLAARKRRILATRRGNVVAAWNEIMIRLRRLGDSVPSHLTPLELAAVTGKELEPLATIYTAHVCEGLPRGNLETAFHKADSLFGRKYETSERFRSWIGIPLPRRISPERRSALLRSRHLQKLEEDRGIGPGQAQSE